MKSKKRFILPSAFVLAVLLPVVGAWAFFTHVDYSESNQSGVSVPETSQPKGLYPVEVSSSPLEDAPSSQEESVSVPQSAPPAYAPEQAVRPEMSAEDKATLERMDRERAEQQAKIAAMQCESLDSKYSLAVMDENSYHQQRLNTIKSDYQIRGLGFSGMYQADVAAENTRHQQKLDSLQTDYSNQKSLYNC